MYKDENKITMGKKIKKSEIISFKIISFINLIANTERKTKIIKLFFEYYKIQS